MRNSTFTILCLILLIGVFQAKSQNKFKSQEEHRAFKQELMNEAQAGYDNQILFQEVSKQKSFLASNDFGDAPALNWAGQFGGSGNDYGRDIISDAAGNVYVSGHFSGEITIGTASYTSIGTNDAIVAKFSNTGSLLWLTQLSPSSGEKVQAYGICLDASDNIYVTGYYTGSVTFGDISLPNNAYYNLFFAKLSNSGEVQMAKNHGYAFAIGLKIDTDDNGNIYIIGSRSTSVNSGHPSVILKYDQSGNIVWEQEHNEGFSDMQIYGTSIYYAGVNMGGDDGYLDYNVSLGNPAGYNDIFYAKADLNGNFIWGVMASHVGEGDSMVSFLCIDSNENIYVTGSFRQDVIFGDYSVSSDVDANFIAKCNSNGVFSWVKLIVSYGNSPRDISVDINGNSYVAYSNQITKFDITGTEQWTEWVPYIPYAITNNSFDKLLTTGSADGLSCVSQLDNSANEEWLVNFEGNSASGNVIGMVTDNSGNVYTYGYASNTIDYFGEEVIKGIFICKQNGSGNVIWLKQFADIYMNYGSQGDFINIDTITSNIYITGELDDELIIPGEAILTPAEGGSVFILKYDLNGNFVWSVQEDFYGIEPSVVPDNSGNVILSGVFSGEITIGNTELTSLGDRDGFVAKYDASGNFLWAIRAGGESTEYLAIVSTDANNNIYLSGEFTSENVTVDEIPITLNEGDGNVLFAKLNADGAVQWVKSFAASHHDWNDGYCWPTGIKTDADGYTYLKGSYRDITYFDDILLTNPFNQYSKFIAKIDPDGNAVWAKTLNQHISGYWYDYNQFDVDKDGNVYFGFQVRDTLDFGDDFQYIASGLYDLFIAKYTTNGELDWVKIMQGNGTSYNWISSVAVFGTENVFVGGFLGDYLSFDDEELSSTNRHGFVTMFGDDMVGVKEVYNRNNKQFDIYPNPSTGLVTFTSNFKLNNIIEILNVTGQIVHTVNITSKNQQIDLSNLNMGVYFVKLSGDDNCKTEKIIIE